MRRHLRMHVLGLGHHLADLLVEALVKVAIQKAKHVSSNSFARAQRRVVVQRSLVVIAKTQYILWSQLPQEVVEKSGVGCHDSMEERDLGHRGHEDPRLQSVVARAGIDRVQGVS